MLDTITKLLVAEVIKLIKLNLIMPARNIVRERSFSLLKRIKICSTATNNWLNCLLDLRIHKLLTDKLDLTKVADEFVEKRKRRKSKFGLYQFC